MKAEAAARSRDDVALLLYVAWPLLDEAIGLGFVQPDIFEGDLEAAFATDERWQDAADRMSHGPPPDLELLDWPDPADVLDHVAMWPCGHVTM